MCIRDRRDIGNRHGFYGIVEAVYHMVQNIRSQTDRKKNGQNIFYDIPEIFIIHADTSLIRLTKQLYIIRKNTPVFVLTGNMAAELYLTFRSEKSGSFKAKTIRNRRNLQHGKA